MAGPLTAADDYTFEETEDLGMDGMDLGFEEMSVEPIGAGTDGIAGAYDAAIERLRAQRSGLSGKERIGALLVGFGQPTRSGKWQEGVANAAQLLLQQKLASRQADEARRMKLEELMARRDVDVAKAGNARDLATIRANAAAGKGKSLNAEQIKRMGYAKRAFPGKSDEELMTMLYEPVIDRLMVAPQIAASAASGGYDASQYMPPGLTVAELQQQARDALAKGAPRDQVIQRLRQWAIPIEGI